MTTHAVTCKRTGEPLAIKLDGGTCVCPSIDKCQIMKERNMSAVDEIRDLVASGDMKLSEYRDHYKAKFGRDTTLSDDRIIEMIAATEDDMPPDEWADLMLSKE